MIAALSARKSLHFRQALLPNGWQRDVRLTMRGGCILRVESGVTPVASDDCHAVGLPGMSNLHSHAFQRGMAGLTEVRGHSSDSFWTWRDTMYRFVDRITPDLLCAIAALAYCEMLESGFTRVGEFHYLHHDHDGAHYADTAEMSGAIVAAAGMSGIGLTLLPVFYAHAGFGGLAPQASQRRFINDVDQFVRLHAAAQSKAATLPDAVVGVAPHSLRAVTAEELHMLDVLGATGPIHIHIAEQEQEVADCIAWCGARPVAWLLDHATVDDRWCLVHATHMTRAESVSLAKSGAVAGLCPITEANLGDGIFPADTFLASGGRFGIGSDSNVCIDMTEELRLLEYGQRLTRRGRNILAGGPARSTGESIYCAAVNGGAQALGVTAGLSAGNSADVLSLDLDHPSMEHREGSTLLDSLIFAAGRSAIDCVWRRGERVVRAGRHIARDAIVRDYRAALMEVLVDHITA